MNIDAVELSVVGDERGSLVAIQGGIDIPFDIKRVYYLFGTKLNVIRGEHAHRNLRQLLICVNGSCEVMLDDGTSKKSLILDSPSKGVLVESCIWREMSEFSEGCVLLVLADSFYEKEDYIRNYPAFLEEVRAKSRST